MNRITLSICAMLCLSGCATVLNDSTHSMRVDTLTEDGQLVSGAECNVRNDKSHASFRSGETIQVRRSARDLDIVCRHQEHADAVGRATSRANAGMWGNIIAGGAVGAIVDHNKGTAYTYPTWVRLVFGWVTTFDRRHEDTGSPVDGERVSRTAPPAPPPAPSTSPAAQQDAPAREGQQRQDAWMKWRGD